MDGVPREVLLVGSVPLRPAGAVFEEAVRHLGSLIRSVPDGEQLGWIRAAFRSFSENPKLVVSRQVPLAAGGQSPINVFRLREGVVVGDDLLGPYGYARNALESYEQFMTLKAMGRLPADLRYTMTMPGPGTSAYVVQLPAAQLLPIARAALWREIEQVLALTDHSELTIQLDIAMEAEHEEYLRRPEVWDQPVHSLFDWSLEEMAESVAWLANQIPEEVELGFHICSIWHHDPGAGQDNNVLVDAANAIIKRLSREVRYVHIPIIPEHAPRDYEALAGLELGPETKLFLGLINLADGLEGAQTRIAMAERVVQGFGVAMFCGLGHAPDRAAPQVRVDPGAVAPQLRRATPETVGEVLTLHRRVAEVLPAPATSDLRV